MKALLQTVRQVLESWVASRPTPRRDRKVLLQIENLEQRQLLSATAIAPPSLGPALSGAATPQTLPTSGNQLSLTAQALSDTQIQVTWSAGGGVSSYHLWIQSDNSPRGVNYELQGEYSTTSTVVPNCSPSTVYRFFVQGYVGDSPYYSSPIVSTQTLPQQPRQPILNGTGVKSVSVAYTPQNELVEAIVYTNGNLYMSDASGMHYIGTGVQSASVAFDSQGHEVVDAVFTSGQLWQYDANGAHYIGSGVESVSVAFNNQDQLVTAAAFTGGGLYVFNAYGYYYAAPNVQSVTLTFDSQGNQVLDLVYTDTTLYQFDSAGEHYIASGAAQATVSYNREGVYQGLSIVFASGEWWLY